MPSIFEMLKNHRTEPDGYRGFQPFMSPIFDWWFLTKIKKEIRLCFPGHFTCRLHAFPRKLVKVFQSACKERRIDPYAYIIGRMHFFVIQNHEDYFFAVNNAEPCLIVRVPDICNARYVFCCLHAFFCYRGCNPYCKLKMIIQVMPSFQAS